MRTRLSSSDPVPSPLDPSTSSGQVTRGKSGHRPVLLHEVIRALDIRSDDIVVDATLGGAGHARAIAESLGKGGVLIGFDMDADAIERARTALRGTPPSVHLVCGDFRTMDRELRKRGIMNITKTLFDLGWSSYQLDSGRGFSFNADEPLLMTYQKSSEEDTLTASTIVNTWSEESLSDIIFGFGGERYSRRIAKAIVERRKKSTFQTSRELANFIKAHVPPAYRHGRIHPATRTFQALRIAVNDELGALSEGLSSAWKMLARGGRIAVISFHSVEDRIVKRMFAEWEKSGEGKLLAKKPIAPDRAEAQANPRARSAKLRVIEKISHESSHSKNKQIRPLDFSGET